MMTLSKPTLLAQLTTNPKRLFLVDSLGAFLTAFLLGIVLTNFVEYIGIPKKILVTLSLLALVFAIYSLVCHFLVCKHWRSYLLVIAMANSLYCCLTIAMMIYFLDTITLLGVFYFLGEIIVIAILVYIESLAVKKHKL